MLAQAGIVPGRIVGLTALGIVAGAQVWAGIALTRRAGARAEVLARARTA
jgi:hypothetical protein